MDHVSGNPVTTNKIIYRLRLMADAGGMITRDRKKTIIEAADRLEDLDERVAIMSEPPYNNTNPGVQMAQDLANGELEFNFGGEANEEH